MVKLRPALCLVAVLALGAWCSSALGDAIGYSLVSDRRAESDDIVVEHHHDWSEATRKARWKMISGDKNVLGRKNTYSFVRATRRNDGERIFQVPTPALSYLWISPDSRFIVGISSIKLWNPLQLVVLDANGNVLLAKAIGTSTFPGVEESVSNWVGWYKEPTPEIAIDRTGDSFVLRIEGNSGVERRFEFHARS